MVKSTNFCNSSKVKFDRSYSSSQGTLLRVNLALYIENSGLFLGRILPMPWTISSILLTLPETNLTVLLVSLQSVHDTGGLLLDLCSFVIRIFCKYGLIRVLRS